MSRRAEPVWYLVPDGVVQYINKYHLYAARGPVAVANRRRRAVTATQRALDLAKAAALAAEDKIAHDVIGHRRQRAARPDRRLPHRVGGQRRQVGAIVDEIEDKLREAGVKPVRREGEREGRWVLIDFGDIVVHVQHAEERELLPARAALEGLPGDRAGVQMRRQQ